MAIECDSTVDVVHGCFPEGVDSILSAFSREPLTKSHDQPGCACARTWPVNVVFASKIHVK